MLRLSNSDKKGILPRVIDSLFVSQSDPPTEIENA